MDGAGRAAIVSEWAHGYCHARGYGAPYAIAEGFLGFDVEKAGESARVIALADDEATIGAAFAAVRRPCTIVEFFSDRARFADRFPASWTPRDVHSLMAIDALPGEATALPVSDAVQGVDESAHRIALEIVAGERVAVSGVIGLAGDVATFNQIVTHPDARRLGWGMYVMNELSRLAVARGARRGVLIATDEGRALYECLGWSMVSDVVSAISPAAAVHDAARRSG